MMPMPLLRTEREFARVSIDRSGVKISIKQQLAANRRDADARGTTLHSDPYTDTGSISHYARTERVGGDWERMINDIRNDRFDADGLRLWESSRAYREMADTVTLLDLCRDKGIWITITTHERVYNPRNWRDRKTLMEDAIDNEAEPARTSDRLRRDVGERAEAGRPHGRMAFGYKALYDESTGKMIKRVAHPAEGPLVTDAFARVKRGESISSIARMWEEKGVLTKEGKIWSVSNLSALLRRPLYAGIRLHDPGWQNASPGHPSQYAREFQGDWEPLVDEETWRAVSQIMSNPKRGHGLGTRVKHPFSGVLGCGVCETGMRVDKYSKTGESLYRCPTGHVSIAREGELGADAVLYPFLFAYLSDPDLYQRTFLPPRSEELAEVRKALTDVRTELKQLRTAGLSAATIIAVVPPLEVKEAQLVAQEESLESPDPLLGLIEPGADIAGRWEHIDIGVRHKVAQRAFVKRFVGRPLVMPQARRGRSIREPAVTRIVWDQADGRRAHSEMPQL